VPTARAHRLASLADLLRREVVLPYISPISPIYLPYISPISPLQTSFDVRWCKGNVGEKIFQPW
jgi:hypothetical protein